MGWYQPNKFADNQQNIFGNFAKKLQQVSLYYAWL